MLDLLARPAPQCDTNRHLPVGRGLACSALAHGALLAAALLALSRAAGPLSDGSLPLLLPQSMVWLSQPAPGGGGGGGGNRMNEPPTRLARPGNDPVSVPAARPQAVTPPPDLPTDAPPPDQQLVVPVLFSGASLDTRPGSLDGAADASLSRGPGSGTGAGGGRGSGIGDGVGPGMGPGEGGGTGGGYFRPGAGVESPVPILKVKPLYTAEAMRLRIRGSAWVECIVLADGTVARPRIVRSLDPTYGLDDEALRAAARWRFRPGRYNGQPVPVLITIALDFNVF